MSSTSGDNTNTPEHAARSLIGRPLMDAWVPVALAEDGPARQVLKAEPIEGHNKVLVHVVRVPETVDRDALASALDGVRRVRNPHVLRILMDGWIGPQSLIVVTPSLGATPWATALVTRPPSRVEAVRVVAQVARGLHAVHAHGRIYGVLTPEHVLVVPDRSGSEEAALLPTWWSWRYGFSTSEARPWQAPEVLRRGQERPDEPPAHDRAGDAWALGALAWHSLVGEPPPTSSSTTTGAVLPTLTERLRAPHPEALEAIIAALLHPDPKVRPIDLGRVADRLDEVVHHLEGGGPMIGPPMVTATPIPFGGQLRERSLVLPVPPPPAHAGPAREAPVPPAATPPTHRIRELPAQTAASATPAPRVGQAPLLDEEPVDTLDLPSPQPAPRAAYASPQTPDSLARAPAAMPPDPWRAVGPVVASAGLGAVALLLVLYLAGWLG